MWEDEFVFGVNAGNVVVFVALPCRTYRRHSMKPRCLWEVKSRLYCEMHVRIKMILCKRLGKICPFHTSVWGFLWLAMYTTSFCVHGLAENVHL